MIVNSIFVGLVGLFFLNASAQTGVISKHFKNPVDKAEIETLGCAVAGGVYGIMKHMQGSVVCFAHLKDSKKEVVIIYDEKSKAEKRFLISSGKVFRSSKGQSSGQLINESTVIELDSSWNEVSSALPYKIVRTTSWTFGEGSVFLTARIPGLMHLKNIPYFSLSEIDREVEALQKEL